MYGLGHQDHAQDASLVENLLAAEGVLIGGMSLGIDEEVGRGRCLIFRRKSRITLAPLATGAVGSALPPP